MTIYWRAVAIAAVFSLNGACVRTAGSILEQDEGDGNSLLDLHHDGASKLFLGKITVFSLQGEWSTANTIRWRWNRSGIVSNFGAYQLIVGLTEEDVATRRGSAVIWTGKENPELDHFTLPNTTGDDPVVMVMTDLHQPDTNYFGQLMAVDREGEVSVSNIAMIRTKAHPINEVILFSEEPTAGYSIPDNMKYKTDSARAFQGEHYYEYISSCGVSNGGSCWQNLRRQGIARSIAAIPQQAFETTAFYEIAVACSGSHSYYSHVRLMFSDESLGSGFWANPGWSMRCNNQYRLIQIPLRELISEQALPYEVIRWSLEEFGVGGNWSNNSTVRLDEARVRW